MAANAFFITTLMMMALGIFALQELQFLIPYRAYLIHECAVPVGLYLACVFLNCFAATYSLIGRFFLKQTGRKLAHLEKQLRSGPSLSEDLSDRLKEEYEPRT